MFIYNDIIHGSIEIPNIVESIIETRYFQRLNRIKQLGCVYLLYDKANHTRFSHCIGTYYLANVLMKTLEKNTSNLEISPFYKLCISLAGLLHDIGHGPFSHTWEYINENFSHEKNAGPLIDAIFDEISEKYKLSTNQEEHVFGIQLIKSLIIGERIKLSDPKMEFIYEIISNKQCDIDVDKWDYLKRDYQHFRHCIIDEKISFEEFSDFFNGARVSFDRKHIEYCAKDLKLIQNIFLTRRNLHMNFYQNPSVRAFEEILLRLIETAMKNDYKFLGKAINRITASDLDTFLEFTDENILIWLEKSNDKQIKKWLKYYYNKSIKEVSNNNIDLTNGGQQLLKVQINVEVANKQPQLSKIPLYGNHKTHFEPPFERYHQDVHYFIITE